MSFNPCILVQVIDYLYLRMKVKETHVEERVYCLDNFGCDVNYPEC